MIFVVIELWFILENWINFFNRTLVGEDSGVVSFSIKFYRITTIELYTKYSIKAFQPRFWQYFVRRRIFIFYHLQFFRLG